MRTREDQKVGDSTISFAARWQARLRSLAGIAALVVGVALTGCATGEKSVRPAARPETVIAPVSNEVAGPAEAPSIRARHAILIDARTGATLYQKFADSPVQVASTQKLVTALVVLDSGNLDIPVTVQREDTLVEPGKLGVRAGQVYTRRNLLTAMMVKSENDAAAILARDNAGSIPAFAGKMNQKAFELGARSSCFVNPHGLPGSQYSTARDMARIAFEAYHNPLMRQMTATKYYRFYFTNGRSKLLENTNKLLGHMPACNGMKTGYTFAAGRCLVSSASAGGREVILVQLGSRTQDIFNDAQAMMAWGLSRSSAPFYAAF